MEAPHPDDHAMSTGRLAVEDAITDLEDARAQQGGVAIKEVR